ncbi:MAG: hypothetical protein AAGG48_00505 [Planctomycetota bacterium]
MANQNNVKRWFTVISTLVFILVLFIVVRTQGYVSGFEFSPSHFQQREFSFYEIPLLHVQITPIKRSSATPVTAIYVRQNGLIPIPTGTPQDWQLVSISRGLTGSTPADAQLLVDQLQLGTDDEYWRTWSKDQPKQAKVLWPIIQDLSARELYILMPPLFELAQIDHTPEDLRAAIDDRLQSEYIQLIQDMHDADRDDLATELLSEAISDYPENEELKQLQNSKN